MKSAFFAGTFNPFTVGHESIVSRGLSVFDRIVIGIGFNPDKGLTNDLQERAALIRSYYAGRPEVEVAVYSGLTAEEARRRGCSHLLRSVRTTADFEYEKNLADANLKIFGLDTLILFAEPELSYVSSSLVRELNRHGVDTSKYLPNKKD